MTMKIAVFHNLPSGGAKRALYNFVRYLSKHHTIDVFIPSTANEEYLPLKDFVDNIFIFNIKKSIFKHILSIIKYFPLIRSPLLYELERVQRKMAERINKADYDVVFSEQDQYTYSPFILKYLNKPTVYYCQQPHRFFEAILNRINPLYSRSWIQNVMYRKIAQIDIENASHCKYILTNSYYSRETILRVYGLNAYVCYLGVDISLFKPMNVRKDNYVLSVGYCAPHKGFDFIIRALGLIKKDLRPKFVIISNEVNRIWKKHLENLAERKGVKLEIKRMVTDRDLVIAYNKAKLVLYAPYLEPFGLVPLEAMACGVPVVAVREGGVRESVVDGRTGMLTERDEEEFAEAVEYLLTNEDIRDEMSRNCFETILNFWTIEHSGKRLESHLKRAIKKW